MKRMRFILCTLLLALSVSFGGCGKGDEGQNSNNEANNNEKDKEPTPKLTPQALQFTETQLITEPVLICLDAGHGFDDPGCVTDLMDGTESEITFDVVMRVKERLESVGAEVILTHDGEVFPSVAEIRQLADSNGIRYAAGEMYKNNIFSAYERAVYCQGLNAERKIDLFISFHINSIDGKPEVSRYDIYYSDENPYADALTDFCSSLETKLDNRLSIHAERRKDAMLVVKYAKFPALLMEMGFATNADDAAKLNSEAWRNSYASIMADQIVDFVLTYKD